MEGGNHQASGPVDQLLNLIDGKAKGPLTENLLQGESSETFGIDNGLHISVIWVASAVYCTSGD